MRIFPSSSPFDSDVEKVTPEEDKGDDWAKILDICDKVGQNHGNAKDCLKSIVKRLNNPNPHVVLKAITLLDACVKNCAKVFLLEVASRDFETEYRKLLKKYSQTQPKIADRLKLMLKKWAENDFKSDSQLSLIPSVYAKLKQEGVDFPTNQEMKSATSQMPKDPNAVTSQQEVDDIAKAIELSLQETSNKSSGQSSLYPTANTLTSSFSNRTFTNSALKPSKQKVRALYDFEAAEDNELTFYAGEIIEVLDDSDKNWWKGVNKRGEGLFPANFVTSDLSSSSETNSESESNDVTVRKARVHFSDTVATSSGHDFKREEAVINEQKIDRLLHLLHEANPTDESADTEEMLVLEEEVNAMGPLIDAELEKVDRKHAQLTQLSSNLVDALNLYHSLMREPFHTLPSAVKGPYMMQPMPVHGVPHPHQMMYNGGMNGPPYSMPPNAMLNDHFPPPNTLPSASNMPPGSVHQPPPHLFAPIQSDGNFHHQNMMQNPGPPNHPYQSMPPNMVPLQYQMPPGSIPQQQMPPPNMYQHQQMPHTVPSHDTSTSNLQNH